MFGSGNVATHLGRALKLAGHTITEVWSRTFENAQILASLLKARAVDEVSKVSQHADLYIISVNDDAIREIAASVPVKNKLIIHTSGSVAIDVLKAFSSRYGVFYPLQTFSKSRRIDFHDIPLIVEGSSDSESQTLKEIAMQLSSAVYALNSEQRQILHVSAVFACNFTNHLYAIAENLLSEHALDFNMLRPLITETAEKIKMDSPLKVQTGPAIRKDKKTINKHLTFLKDNPEMYILYQLLSQSIVNLKQRS